MSENPFADGALTPRVSSRSRKEAHRASRSGPKKGDTVRTPGTKKVEVTYERRTVTTIDPEFGDEWDLEIE